TMRVMMARRSGTGERNTQGRMMIARRITLPGVCTRIAAMVPTTTIISAAQDTSACSPAPLRTAPTSSATSARTMPIRLNTSSSSASGAPVTHARTQAYQGLSVDLADAGFTDAEHRANFLQVQFLVVVERHHQPLTLRQAGNGGGQPLAQGALLGFTARISGVVRHIGGAGRFVEAADLACGGVLHDAVVFLQRNAHRLGHFGAARLAAFTLLDGTHRGGRLACLAMHRARRPVQLAQ